MSIWVTVRRYVHPMKRAATTFIAVSALAMPTHALAAPVLGAPLPAAKSAQAGTSGTGTTTTSTSTTPTTTVPVKPLKLTINELADRKALNAYATYLTALISQEPVSLTNDDTYVAALSQPGSGGGCKAALWKLTQPPYQVDTKAQHTLTVLGEEVGDDLTITYDADATEAFTKFAGALESLKWGRFSGAELITRRYVSTQTSLLAMTASSLCQDALDAQLRPDIVPEGTKAFLPLYNLASKGANATLTSLLTLMQTYEIPSEKALIARITTLANQLATQTKTDLLQSGTALTTALESS